MISKFLKCRSPGDQILQKLWYHRITGVRFADQHIQLLRIDGFQNFKKLCIGFRQFNAMIFHKIQDISKISSNVLKLLFDGFSDLFRSALSAFCKCKIVLSCLFTVHSRSVEIVFVTDPADHIFQLFTDFIQQFNVLWKLDILRRTGCIKDQCAGIFGCFRGILETLLLILLPFSAAIAVIIIVVLVIFLRVVGNDHFIDLINKKIQDLLKDGVSDSLANIKDREDFKKLMEKGSGGLKTKAVEKNGADLVKEFVTIAKTIKENHKSTSKNTKTLQTGSKGKNII